MDNKTESIDIKENTENSDNSGITSNNDNNKDTPHEINEEEETTSSSQPHETPLNIISDQNTTQQDSELPIIPSNSNIPAALTSDVVVPASTIGSNVAAHQKTKSRHSSSEDFVDLDDNVSMRYPDTMTFANRQSRKSAPPLYRPRESDVRPRPSSVVTVLPTSMIRYNPTIMTPSSDHVSVRMLNWPIQNHESQQSPVGLNIRDNLVNDGEIIFDTISSSGIQQFSHGQISPQGRFSVTAAKHQVTNQSRAPEVPSFILNYGIEIFDQIQSDDDPRLIVWSSISRAEERKQVSTISSFTNFSTAKRWSIHEKLERAGKTICGAGLKDRFESKLSKNRHSNVTPEKVIMAATIEKLIEKLTSGIDYTFLTDFFLTYRAFITPLQLCNLLILRFDWALGGDDVQRKIVRVRTFVTLRHWLLNYFGYDFVPSRVLRSRLVSYLNNLHPLVRNSPRDQKLVQGLKRVIRRLKRIYYKKGILKNENGVTSGSGKGKKVQQEDPEQFLGDDVISVEHGGVGAGTSSSSKEKSKRTIKHESSSTLGSTLTPGTTDSEEEEFSSLGHYKSSRSRITRPTEFRQSLEATSSNSQYSEDEFSLKHVDEDHKQENAIAKKKLKTSNSTGDLSQRKKLQMEFNTDHNLKGDDIIVEEPPPLPPRRQHRRHTFTYTQSTPASPSFFKSGFLRKPKKVISQESMSEKFQDRTRKKRSLSLSEAICGFAEDDDDEDEDDEFDLSRIDHAGGIARRNSSPAYIESSTLRDKQEKGGASRRKTGRPSWPQKMSATMGKFAKVLFTPGTGKLCANPDIAENSESPVSEKFNDEHIHLDGFSYVDESLEEEFFDRTRQDDFAGTEEHYSDEPSEEEEEGELQEVVEEEEETIGVDYEGSTSLSTESYPFPTLSTSIQDYKNVDLEENSQTTRSIRRKIRDLGPVLEDDEEKKMDDESSSKNKKTEDLQSRHRRHRLAKVYEVEENEPNIIVTPTEPLESEVEQSLDIEEEEEEQDENNPSHRLRRLPKVRDLRSVVTLKDLEETSGKRVSWSTFSSLGTLGNEDKGTTSGTEAILSRALTSSSSKLNHKESIKSSSEVETESQGEKETSKEVEQELVIRKDKSIMKPPSSEPVASSSNVITGSPKKSSESSIKHIVITEPPSKKLPDIPVQHTTAATTTTTVAAEPSSSSKIPINIPFTIQKSSLNKPLPPLPIQDNQSKRPPSISSTLSSQVQYRSFILNYRSEDIAKQFCLIERDFLSKVVWEDLVQVGYNTNNTDDENVQNLENEEKKEKKEKKKDIKGKGKVTEYEEEEEKKVLKERPRKRIRENGVDKVIDRFNLACDWVATEIVLTRSLDYRVQVIEKFIRIAQKCLQFSNFATLTQILLGLQSPPVERLRRTWTRVRNEDLRVFKELSEYISAFGNWKVIREAMKKSIEDSTILKELIKQRKSRAPDIRKVNIGCIPFLGLYLSDLVFNAAVPSFIDPTPPSQPSTPSSPLPSSSTDTTTTTLHHQPLVNFHKYRTTATIVKRVLTFQNLSKEYNFSVDKEIYDKCFGLKGLEATKLVVMDLDVDDFV